MNGMFFINKEQSVYFSIQATNFRWKGSNNGTRGNMLKEKENHRKRPSELRIGIENLSQYSREPDGWRNSFKYETW